MKYQILKAALLLTCVLASNSARAEQKITFTNPTIKGFTIAGGSADGSEADKFCNVVGYAKASDHKVEVMDLSCEPGNKYVILLRSDSRQVNVMYNNACLRRPVLSSVTCEGKLRFAASRQINELTYDGGERNSVFHILKIKARASSYSESQRAEDTAEEPYSQDAR